MDSTLYVRLEGVNLDNFVYDVHDLSTIRGGSFLLLDAVRRVADEFPKSCPVTLEAVSTGASSGLFRCSGWSGDRDELRRKIEDFLHKEPDLKHATFVVDVHPATHPATEHFERDRESVTSMNRWRQFQQPTLAVPSPPAEPANDECSFDHVRPAAVFRETADGRKRVSESVAVRRDHGQEKKQEFYAGELRQLRPKTGTDETLETLIGRVEKAHFANDLETLTADANERRKPLHWKMAILYFDGNGFGKQQLECSTPEKLEEFDKKVKTCRRTLLRGLLAEIFRATDNGWWTSTGKVRLETLLWGGDELTLVVPAWKGWDVIRLFYEESKSWKHAGKFLTHSGGVVFCHRSSPIHRMRQTAYDLAGLCKSHRSITKAGDTHEESDLFGYQVFESSDLIAGPLEKFREERVPLGRPATELLVNANGIGNLIADYDVIRRGFPRSKLHEIVLALREGDATDLVSRTVSRLGDAERLSLERLFQFFGRTTTVNPWESCPTGWFHLADLWDYAIS